MYESVKQRVDEAQRIVIIQPENPDADSLGTAAALEEILSSLGKEVVLFSVIDMPKYLHYIDGWSRVENTWTGQYDLAIIVDTAAEALLIKTLEVPGTRHFFETHPVLVLDHHNDEREDETSEASLSFPHEFILDEAAAATSELLYSIAMSLNWPINQAAAENMLASVLGDTLGLSTQSVTEHTMETVLGLMKQGAHPSNIEQKRREYMKKPADILSYKGELIQRIEYYCDDRLALVHIPWEDIAQYSDRYNPSVLVLDEMRLVENVDVAIAIKTYPDQKLTGKIRSNIPVSDTVAGYFGGGGHSYSAGYKIYEDYETARRELVQTVAKLLKEYDHAHPEAA
ncbi:MAG TPA: DHH family phosphoesterase [Candidatus Saccharibacteria bacterium]|nr:DHH family phosphoesterase [Candidatus Saccharibacteria bacterium]